MPLLFTTVSDQRKHRCSVADTGEPRRRPCRRRLLRRSQCLRDKSFSQDEAQETVVNLQIAVVVDGSCGVIAARRLGAKQIIVLGRDADRIALARRFGATDVVSERRCDRASRRPQAQAL